MNKEVFKNRFKQLDNLAKKYKWIYVSVCNKTFRATYKDDMSIFRVDVYLSKMTICLHRTGEDPIYFRKKNFKTVENILKNPFQLKTT